MIPGKRYLGDGVYVHWDGWSFVLTTENGLRVLDRIVLEPTVYAELEAFARAVAAAVQQSAGGEV